MLLRRNDLVSANNSGALVKKKKRTWLESIIGFSNVTVEPVLHSYHVYN